jgi:tetrahydromethanopterin S-methyltransferase subunit G
MSTKISSLERENLEAHVDLCALRYEQLDSRLTSIEEKVEVIHKDIQVGQQSMTKVVIGASGTIIAGLLSTVIVILMNF